MAAEDGESGAAAPPAPAWFGAALAREPERRLVAVEGVDLEVLAWGERGRPGLLLIHGFSAHADWWSFTAPLLCAGRRVVAFSLSGMGGSGWRERYSLAQHAREAVAVARAEGLFAASSRPIVIGHSFGSFVARIVARECGASLGGVIHVDGALASTARRVDEAAPRLRHKVHPTLAEARARFRFVPAQACENGYLVDFIARTSLGRVSGKDGAAGWAWRFDPDLGLKMDPLPNEALMGPASCPMALVFGDRSPLMTSERLELIRQATPSTVPWIVIPDAGHHIMVDQPLALVAALRSLLAAWQPAVSRPDPPAG